MEKKLAEQAQQAINDNGISNKAQDFIKILDTEDVNERKRIEKEIWREMERLISDLEVIKEKRRVLLFNNNEIYIKMAKNKEEIKVRYLNFINIFLDRREVISDKDSRKQADIRKEVAKLKQAITG